MSAKMRRTAVVLVRHIHFQLAAVSHLLTVYDILGTGNCEECHVTVNFLSNCHQSAPLTCITGMYHNKNEEDAPKFTDFPEMEGEENKRSSGPEIEPPPPKPVKAVEFAA
jgi:hypothetical protein